MNDIVSTYNVEPVLPQALQQEVDELTDVVMDKYVSFEMLRQRKILSGDINTMAGNPNIKLSDEERVPLMVQATASLRSPSAKYGFFHVCCLPSGKYFAFYKGMNTGPQYTPMLAAYELLKAAKRKGIDVNQNSEVEYYPEYFANVHPSIDLSLIEHLRDPTVKPGWKGIKLRSNRGVRFFVFDYVIDNIIYKSKPYPTPVEAVWAGFTGKVLKLNHYVKGPDVRTPIDLSIIEYMREGSTYSRVYKKGKYFYGTFNCNGQNISTDHYLTVEQAAWALHHHMIAAPQVGTAISRIEASRMAENSTATMSRVKAEYREAAKDV
jgi:hypothetical protein